MLVLHTNGYELALFNSLNKSAWEKRIKQFDIVDTVIDIMDKPAGMPPIGLPHEKYSLYGEYLRELFQALSSKKKMIQITMPSTTNAELAGMPLDSYEKRVINALDIDYASLKKLV